MTPIGLLHGITIYGAPVHWHLHRQRHSQPSARSASSNSSSVSELLVKTTSPGSSSTISREEKTTVAVAEPALRNAPMSTRSPQSVGLSSARGCGRSLVDQACGLFGISQPHSGQRGLLRLRRL
jgi:hypothetical protein